jgi:hypothetical protein
MIFGRIDPPQPGGRGPNAVGSPVHHENPSPTPGRPHNV